MTHTFISPLEADDLVLENMCFKEKNYINCTKYPGCYYDEFKLNRN